MVQVICDRMRVGEGSPKDYPPHGSFFFGHGAGGFELLAWEA